MYTTILLLFLTHKYNIYLRHSCYQKSKRAQESKSQSAVFTHGLIELSFCCKLKIENARLWIKAALRTEALFPASIWVLPALFFRHSLNCCLCPAVIGRLPDNLSRNARAKARNKRKSWGCIVTQTWTHTGTNMNILKRSHTPSYAHTHKAAQNTEEVYVWLVSFQN